MIMESISISCIIVTPRWSGAGWIQGLSVRPTGFLQCFDTVGLVIWHVKIVPEMTYNVLCGTLSLYTTTTPFSASQLSVSWHLVSFSLWLITSYLVWLVYASALLYSCSCCEGVNEVSYYCRCSGVLKMYLRELPEPLMTFELYDEWMRLVDMYVTKITFSMLSSK